MDSPLSGKTEALADWKHSSTIITSLGLLSGEILMYLETHGRATAGQLSKELGWAVPMVMMAIGTLIRQGLVLARPFNLEIMIQPIS